MLVKFLTIAYPAGDIALFAALMILIYNYPVDRTNTPFILLILSMVVQIGTDVLFSIQSLSETYMSGGWLDSGWVFGYLFLGVAGVVQTSMNEVTTIEDKITLFSHQVLSVFINKLERLFVF
jgi:hypothetical protein